MIRIVAGSGYENIAGRRYSYAAFAFILLRD